MNTLNNDCLYIILDFVLDLEKNRDTLFCRQWKLGDKPQTDTDKQILIILSVCSKWRKHTIKRITQILLSAHSDQNVTFQTPARRRFQACALGLSCASSRVLVWNKKLLLYVFLNYINKSSIIEFII